MGSKRENHPFNRLNDIDLGGSKVILDPPSIFVCGGLVDITKPETLSVRELFFESMSGMGYGHFHDYCIQAENFKDYFENGHYRDLSEFENDLAHFASLLVIFLESAGAIVELGLFSNVPNLKHKLITVVNESHYNKDSFIKLGPLKSLSRDREGSVLVYDWDEKKPGSMDKSIIGFILNDIEEEIRKLNHKETFDKSNPGHVAFLVYEFTRLFMAVRLSEIKAFLESQGINYSDQRVKNIIYLLTISGYLQKKTIGRDSFYLSESTHKRIQFSLVDKSKRFDFEGIRIEASAYYRSQKNEDKRLHVINEAFRGAGR
ncbi:retron St85 family effector protein [Marinobacter salsuginis]|uniref:retron St85 family effector protein n=1 Tax=Marinobacter salsuginis TaxID=418719 RepID=UPI00273F1A04|nr:retron St85 family effector protein [Marinobacter salsuginis]